MAGPPDAAMRARVRHPFPLQESFHMDIQTATDQLRAKVGEDCGLGAVLKFDCGADGVVVIDATKVPNGVSNDVTVIDVASLKALKSIAVGSYPWGVAITRR